MHGVATRGKDAAVRTGVVTHEGVVRTETPTPVREMTVGRRVGEGGGRQGVCSARAAIAGDKTRVSVMVVVHTG